MIRRRAVRQQESRGRHGWACRLQEAGVVVASEGLLPSNAVDDDELERPEVGLGARMSTSAPSSCQPCQNSRQGPAGPCLRLQLSCSHGTAAACPSQEQSLCNVGELVCLHTCQACQNPSRESQSIAAECMSTWVQTAGLLLCIAWHSKYQFTIVRAQQKGACTHLLCQS